MKYTLYYIHACSDEYCASCDVEGQFDSLEGAQRYAENQYGGPTRDEWEYDDILREWTTEGDDSYNYYTICERAD